jgi:hypothetical protein
VIPVRALDGVWNDLAGAPGFGFADGRLDRLMVGGGEEPIE